MSGNNSPRRRRPREEDENENVNNNGDNMNQGSGNLDTNNTRYSTTGRSRVVRFNPTVGGDEDPVSLNVESDTGSLTESEVSGVSASASAPTAAAPISSSTETTGSNNSTPLDDRPAIPPNWDSDSGRGLESTIRDFFRDELTRATDSSLAHESAAIVISINYVYSDNGDPSNPNRTGILTLTLPNSASTRDPNVLHEFVRLATQMAYATMVNSEFNTKGITIEKFNSLKELNFQDLVETQCSICLENFINAEIVSEEINTSRKRRKLNDFIKSTPTVSTTTTTETTNENSNDGVNANDNNINNNTSNDSNDDTNNDTQGHSERPMKYLSEITTEYSHVPLQLPCSHVFGKSCLCEWLKNHDTCPLCRKKVTENDPVTDGNSNNRNSDTSNNNNNSERNIFEELFSVNRNDNVYSLGNTEFTDLFNSITQRMGANNNNNTSTDTTNQLEENNNNSNNNSTTTPTSNSNNSGAGTSRIFGHPRRSRNNLASFGRRIVNGPSNILTYIRRRSNNDLMASGVESRRTGNGVVTNSVFRNSPPPVLTSRLFQVFPPPTTSNSSVLSSTTSSTEGATAENSGTSNQGAESNGNQAASSETRRRRNNSVAEEILDYLNLRNLGGP